MEFDMLHGVIFLFGIISIVVGIKIILKINRLKNIGIEASGTILKIQNLQGDNSNSAYPTVSFTTQDGGIIIKSSTISVIPGYYKVGQKVKIIYERNNTGSFIIDNYSTYLIPVILILIGALLILFAVLPILNKI